MGFRLLELNVVLECEHCHDVFYRPADALSTLVCPCQLSIEELNEELDKPERMSKVERVRRYRMQYKANGYSWLGKEPTMWQGDLTN